MQSYYLFESATINGATCYSIVNFRRTLSLFGCPFELASNGLFKSSYGGYSVKKSWFVRHRLYTAIVKIRLNPNYKY